MLSSTVIERPPVTLVIDASRNAAGWEAEVCDRLYTAMARRGLGLIEPRPLRVDLPGDLSLHAPLLEAASSILLVGPGASASLRASLKVWGYWEWLVANVAGPKLFACCSWEDYDASLSDLILQASDELAPIAVVQQSPVAARDGALFFLKFFTELELHSEGRITGRMAWFSWSKAKELLKRRRLPATFGLRA